MANLGERADRTMKKHTNSKKIGDGDHIVNFEDEDDSQERKAALSSPMKGRDVRNVNQVGLNKQLISSPSLILCRLRLRLSESLRPQQL